MTMWTRKKLTPAERAQKAEEAAARAQELAEQARREAAEAAAAEAESEADAADSGRGDAPQDDAVSGPVGLSKADEARTDSGPDETADADGSEASEEKDAGWAEPQDGTPAKVWAGADSDDQDERDWAPPPPPAEAGPRREGLALLAGLGGTALILVLVNAVLAGALAWLWIAKGDKDDLGDAREQATFAATQAAQDLSSYDYRTLDSDFRRAAGHTTGPFHDQFQAEAQRIKTNAAQRQVVVEGTAIKTGIEEASRKRAVALVFLNQQTVDASKNQRLPNQYTLRLSLTKVGNRWLVEKLQVL